MDCPNCGQFLDSSTGAEYVKCEYCRCNIAVFNPSVELEREGSSIGVSEDQADMIRKLLRAGSLDLDGKNYIKAYECFDQILTINPTIWEAVMNQAICLFWMGSEDLKHMKEVKGLINKANVLSDNHEKIEQVKKDIAYNLAAIANLKERFGANVKWSLECFNISREIIEEFDERDQLITDYSEKCGSEIKLRLVKFLERDRKNYDPPFSELKVLKKMVDLTHGREKNSISTLIAFSKHKIKRHKKETGLEEDLKKVLAIYRDVYPIDPEPKIVFPLFGKPGIN